MSNLMMAVWFEPVQRGGPRIKYISSNSKQQKGSARIMADKVGVFINDFFKHSTIGTVAVPLDYVLWFHRGVPDGFPPAIPIRQR